jgi:hypothetical protein
MNSACMIDIELGFDQKMPGVPFGGPRNASGFQQHLMQAA